MFVQVIEGKAKDPEALKQRMEVWEKELRPSASGYLGSTGGVGADGTFIMAARFESRAAAQANSERAEQSKWWEASSDHLENVKFYDCEDVDLWGAGGSDEAGFVQVIQAYATDKDKLRELGRQMDADGGPQRSDVIGGFIAWGSDDGFSQFIYFTSEAEAREGEKSGDGPPQEFRELTRDVRFIDLTDPWLTAP